MLKATADQRPCKDIQKEKRKNILKRHRKKKGKTFSKGIALVYLLYKTKNDFI
jgi:hypothetical protein